jgi:hypothetical protein
MRPGLIGLIVGGSVIATCLTELIVFRMVSPPDASAALLGGAWLAMPYLVAVMLAVMFRNSPVPLTVLLVTLALSSAAGVSLFSNMAVNQKAAEQEVKDAVLPGEDSNHGPAAVRRSGAEIGRSITSVFSILLAVFVPPVQVAVLIVPTLIAWGVSAAVRAVPDEGEGAAG